MRGTVRYVQLVNRRTISHFAHEYWFELLIAAMGIAAMLEVVIWRDLPSAPLQPLWFSLAAIALLMLPLFARRRFPFAAPAAYWILAAALTFVDGQLVAFPGSLNVVGIASAFLLGNLRERKLAVIGL